LTGCSSSDSFSSNIGGGVSPNPEVVYYGSIELVCSDNKADSYQWGYDDKITLDSSLIAGEVNQDYFITTPDFANKYYWVMTEHGGCLQKSYYNQPLEVQQPAGNNIQIVLFPNPANDIIDVQIKTISKNRNIDYKLFDVSGQEITRGVIIGGKETINLSKVSSGIYLINFSDNGVMIGSKTFVKNKG
jgi:hypothetical protein